MHSETGSEALTSTIVVLVTGAWRVCAATISFVLTHFCHRRRREGGGVEGGALVEGENMEMPREACLRKVRTTKMVECEEVVSADEGMGAQR